MVVIFSQITLIKMHNILKYIKITPLCFCAFIFIFATILDLMLYSWFDLNLYGFFIGLAMIVAGGYVFRSAIAEMAEYHTSYRYDQEPRTILTTGPYQFSRNPIYLSYSLCLLGVGFFFANLWIFFFYPFLFLWFNLVMIDKEEVWLSDIFGEDYYQYKRLVRRWF